MGRKKHYLEYCGLPWHIAMIDSTGLFGPCCGKFIGKIKLIRDVQNFWNGKEYRKVRKNLIKGKSKGICADCIYLKVMLNKEYLDEDEVGKIWGCPRPQNPAVQVEQKPKYMAVNFTSRCNLSCFMCRDPKTNPLDERNFPEMPFELIQALAVNYFRDLESLITAGSGEIFVHRNLLKIIDIIQQYRPKLVTTSTNGSFNVSEDLWRRFISVNDLLMFSVDSVSEELHKEIRGFDMKKLFRNLDIVNKIRDNEFPNFKYGFSYVIMKKNVHEMFDFVRKAIDEWGASQINFMHVHGHDDESVLLEKEWQLKYNKQLTLIKDYDIDKDIVMEIPDFAYDADGNVLTDKNNRTINSVER